MSITNIQPYWLNVKRSHNLEVTSPFFSDQSEAETWCCYSSMWWMFSAKDLLQGFTDIWMWEPVGVKAMVWKVILISCNCDSALRLNSKNKLFTILLYAHAAKMKITLTISHIGKYSVVKSVSVTVDFILQNSTCTQPKCLKVNSL